MSESEPAKPTRNVTKRSLSLAWTAAVAVVGLIAGVTADQLVPPLIDRVSNTLGSPPLVIPQQSWPDSECTPADIAVPAGGVTPTSFGQTGPRNTAQMDAAGAAFGHGELTLNLATDNGDNSAYIYGIELVPYTSRPDEKPAWVGEFEGGGCGDSQMRMFEAHADQSTQVVDKGVVGDGDIEPHTPTASLGANFTVSGNDPARIYVDVDACHGYYEFGVKVTYLYRGQRYTKTITDTHGPFKIMGAATPAPLYEYDGNSPLHRSGDTYPQPCQSATTANQTAPPTASPTAPAGTSTVHAFSVKVAGEWTGTLTQTAGPTRPVTMVFSPDDAVATVSYSNGYCSGSVTFGGQAGNTITAYEHITNGPCTPNGTMQLWFTGNGHLLMSYIPAGSSTYAAQAMLTKAA